MTNKEYYKFPVGTNVVFNFIPTYLDGLKPDEPCPSSLKYCFYYSNRRGVKIPDTREVTNTSYMFYFCMSLLEIPYFDTSNVTEMDSMFSGCSALKTIPQFNTSKVTNMNNMCNGCTALESLPALDCGAISMKNYYPINSSLYNYDKLTDVGGFLNMKMSWDNNRGLQKCPNIARESCINILNGLYDFTGNGETPTSSQAVLKVHANFLTAVGDDISIGTNKGWTITA